MRPANTALSVVKYESCVSDINTLQGREKKEEKTSISITDDEMVWRIMLFQDMRAQEHIQVVSSSQKHFLCSGMKRDCEQAVSILIRGMGFSV